MKEEIVKASAESVTLKSGLLDNAFAKTNIGTLLDENGWLATIDSQKIVFTSWHFEKTIINENREVVFKGPGFEGTTLKELFDSNNFETSQAAYDVCTIITEAITQNIPIRICGSGGIIYNKRQSATDFTQVLFLPGNLFERVALNQNDKNYNTLQGNSLKKGLTGNEALAFTRAVFAYKVICGCFPYEERDTERRQADLLDNFFIPTELQINGISTNLANAINRGLKIVPKQIEIPGERHSRSPSQDALQKKENEKAIFAFPLDSLKSELELCHSGTKASKKSCQQDLTDEQFIKQRLRYVRNKHITIGIKRFLRRNKMQILAATITIFIVGAIVTNFHKENQNLATSIGLDSTETTETLYTGIHHADVTIVQEIAKGSHMKNLRQIISGFYVNIKMRQSMDEKNGSVSPGEWFFFRNTSDFWIYGLSNFSIDGVPANTNFNFPTRKNHKTAVKTENGLPIKKGMTVQHTVSYYFLHSDSDYNLNINKTTDIVTLTWRSNRWIVTNITGTSENSTLNMKAFREKYQQALTTNQNDIFKAIIALSTSYSWIPRKDELTRGAERMIKKYNTSAAKEFIAHNKDDSDEQ